MLDCLCMCDDIELNVHDVISDQGSIGNQVICGNILLECTLLSSEKTPWFYYAFVPDWPKNILTFLLLLKIKVSKVAQVLRHSIASALYLHVCDVMASFHLKLLTPSDFVYKIDKHFDNNILTLF